MKSGDRPAIIVQDEAFNNSLPTTLIVPLTSKLSASRFDGTLVIQPNSQNGLTMESVALVFQIRTLDQRQCIKQIGVLDSQSMDDILEVLDQLTGR